MLRNKARSQNRANMSKYTAEQKAMIASEMPFWKEIREKKLNDIPVTPMHHLLKLLNKIGILGQDPSTPRYINHEITRKVQGEYICLVKHKLYPIFEKLSWKNLKESKHTKNSNLISRIGKSSLKTFLTTAALKLMMNYCRNFIQKSKSIYQRKSLKFY